MRLVYKGTNKEVQLLDKIQLAHDTPGAGIVTVRHFDKPHKPSSEGKVTVEFKNKTTHTYYVSVIGAEWIEREDHGFVQWVNEVGGDYYHHDGNNVIKVSRHSVLDSNGNPQGRWESTVVHWNQYATKLNRKPIVNDNATHN